MHVHCESCILGFDSAQLNSIHVTAVRAVVCHAVLCRVVQFSMQTGLVKRMYKQSHGAIADYLNLQHTCDFAIYSPPPTGGAGLRTCKRACLSSWALGSFADIE
jgi:hypothetical protein